MINRSNRLLQLVLALFLVLLTVLTTQRAQAQDETPSPTITKDPTDVSDEEAIEKSAQILKDKIATKVAKLTQQNDKVVTGAIASIDETAIKLQGDEHKDLTIETDEILTQYKSINLSSIEKITREDLSKGDYIVASGTSIDKELSANFILKQEQYLVLEGQISEINKNEFSLRVVTTEKADLTLDVEKSTVQRILNTETIKLESTGFSKFKAGDRIHFVIKKPKKDGEKRASAIRIIIIPQEYFTKIDTKKSS